MKGVKVKKTIVLIMISSVVFLQSCTEKISVPPKAHPDVSEWQDLFAADLSNAAFPKGVWTFEDGVLTASEDQVIWSKKDYDNFIIDLEFKTEDGTNSGVIVYCTNMENWIPN